MDRNDAETQPMSTPRKHGRAVRLRRVAGATALAAVLTAGGLALTHGGPGTAAASANSSVGTAMTAASAQAGTGRGLAGFGRSFGMVARAGAGLTVSAVSGNTITATGRAGQIVTITVNSSTKYTEAGASIALSDIQKGDRIAVQGTRTGTDAITATAVQVVLPRELGVVTNVSGSTLTITGFDGATHTITVGGNTRYEKAGQSAAASDVTNGTAIVAEGTLNSDGSLSAVRITIQVPSVAGQVTAASNGSYTLTNPDGSTTHTVNTTSSTVYVNADGSSAQASSITNGTMIAAQGTLSADGKTLTALRIIILPTAKVSGPMGGFGLNSFGLNALGGSASVTPNSTQTDGILGI